MIPGTDWRTGRGNALVDSTSCHTFVAVALLALATLSCGGGAGKPVLRQTTAMNTYVNVTVYDDLPGERVNHMIDSAVAEIRRIEDMATDYSDSSDVGRINLASGKHPVQVSDELIELIRMSLAYGDSSSGMLDITVGPLVKTWDFLSAQPRVPPEDSIHALLHLVDYHLVKLNGRSVFLPLKGMALDLGSLGKGYAIEKACEVLTRFGAKRFIVDIGGKLGVRWEATRGLDSTVVTVSVRHPRKEGAFLGTFKYGTGAVATSGDYQRYFIVNGKRYHHILDPQTGYPVQGLVGVTVVTQNATEADALSTLVLALGKEKWMEYILKTPGLEGMITYEVDDSLRTDFSSGFKGKFSFDQTNK